MASRSSAASLFSFRKLTIAIAVSTKTPFAATSFPTPCGCQLRSPVLDQPAVDALCDAFSKILVKRLLRFDSAPAEVPRVGGKQDLPNLPFFPANLRGDEIQHMLRKRNSSKGGDTSPNWPFTNVSKYIRRSNSEPATITALPNVLFQPQPTGAPARVLVLGLGDGNRDPPRPILSRSHRMGSMNTLRAGRLIPTASVVVAHTTLISPCRNHLSMISRCSQSRSALW